MVASCFLCLWECVRVSGCVGSTCVGQSLMDGRCVGRGRDGQTLFHLKVNSLGEKGSHQRMEVLGVQAHFWALVIGATVQQQWLSKFRLRPRPRRDHFLILAKIVGRCCC
jgi:hypothetical protein